MQNTRQLDRKVTKAHTVVSVAYPQSSFLTWQQILIHGILRIVSILGAFALVAAIYDAYTKGVFWQIPIIVIAYVFLLVVAFVPRIPYIIQASSILLLVYFIGVFNLIIAGQTGNGIPFLLAVAVLSTLFYSRRLGIGITIFVIITFIIFGFLFINGLLYVPQDVLSGADDSGSWISRGFAFTFLAMLLTIPQYYIFHCFTKTILQKQDSMNALERECEDLKDRLAESTQGVARCLRYLEVSAVVAREAAGVIEDTGELLRHVAELISKQFGFYHTGLFLNDERKEWAVLKAASSEGGRLMLARGHRLLIGSQGIVGYVAMSGQPRIARDVGDDAVFFDNPDLPDTRSEMALPLIIRGEVIGVLDVQSAERLAFEKNDIAALQSLADQVALAISNARLFTAVKENLEADRRSGGELTRDGWRNLLLAEQELSARSTSASMPRGGEVWYPEMEFALQGGAPVVDDESQTRVALPLRVAEQTIGVIAARKSPTAGQWSPEEVGLMHTLAEQLSTAVERARFYRQAQLTATRQRTIAEAGARMRASLQMETMLRTAAHEIRQALDLGVVEIRLTPPEIVSDTFIRPSNVNGVDV